MKGYSFATNLLEKTKGTQPTKLVEWYVYDNILHKTLYYLDLEINERQAKMANQIYQPIK